MVARDQHKKPVLVTDGELRDVRCQRTRIVPGLGQRRTGFRSHLEQDGVEAQEIGKSALRSGQ